MNFKKFKIYFREFELLARAANQDAPFEKWFVRAAPLASQRKSSFLPKFSVFTDFYKKRTIIKTNFNDKIRRICGKYC